MANKYYDIEADKFNISAIMKDAWNGMARSGIRERLSLRLGVIWAQAKSEKERSTSTSADIKTAAIEMTQFLPFNQSQAAAIANIERKLIKAA